jgi:Acyltransferase family
MATEVRPSHSKASPWHIAIVMAQNTPDARNRYADFLRAFSILGVVFGHWMASAPYVRDGEFIGAHLHIIAPWTFWLTWIFQVMPIFFLVGGFANYESWAATRRKNGTYAMWFTGRLQRLINPVLPLFLIWTIVVAAATAMGVDPALTKIGVDFALVPVWFLAVYLLVAALTPLTYAAWQRWRIGSFFVLIAGAIMTDFAAIGLGLTYAALLNLAFVWLALHQLGYAWNCGFFQRRAVALTWGVGGLITAWLLVYFGPYPISMVGHPLDPPIKNIPPKLHLLALGIAQTGFLLALEPAGRRLLMQVKLWAATIWLNNMIMSIYLWHVTAFVIVMIAARLSGDIGLKIEPGGGIWLLTRPVWFALAIMVMMPIVMATARYERAGKAQSAPIALWRIILAILMISAGLGLTALFSVVSPGDAGGIRLWMVAPLFIGAALAQFGPLYTLPKRLWR